VFGDGSDTSEKVDGIESQRSSLPAILIIAD